MIDPTNKQENRQRKQMKMNKIAREAKAIELRSNISRGCTGKGKMKCLRMGNLVSKV